MAATISDEIIFRDLWNKFSSFIMDDPYEDYMTKSEFCQVLSFHNMSKNEISEIYQHIIQQNTDDTNVYLSHWLEYLHIGDTKYINKLKELYYKLFASIDRDHIKSKSSVCYQWRLPRFNRKEIEYICAGFIKQNSIKIVPFDIIRLCITYFGDNMENLFDQFKNTSNGTWWKSGIFCYKAYKFYLDFTIFDSFMSESSEKRFAWYINWLSAPKSIHRLDIDCSFEFMEKFISRQYHLETKTFSGLSLASLSGKDVIVNDVLNLQTMTYNFCINQIRPKDHHYRDIYDINTTKIEQETEKNILSPIIINEKMYQSENTAIFRWCLTDKEMMKIKNAKLRDIIKSPMFIRYNLKWQLWLFPNGHTEDELGQVHIVVHLLGLPPQIDRLNICYGFEYDDKPLKIAENHVEKFKQDSLLIWNSDLLKTKDLIGSDKHVSFSYKMELLHIFDEKEKELSFVNDIDIDPNALEVCSKVKPVDFKWNISKEMLQTIKKESTRISTYLSSPFSVYGFVFVLQLIPFRRIDFGKLEQEEPRVCELEIFLVKLPANIASVSVNYELSLDELNAKDVWRGQFSFDMSAGGSNDIMTSSDLQTLDFATFGCNVKLVNIYDINGKDVTSKVVDTQEIKKDDDDIYELPASRKFEWRVPSDCYDSVTSTQGNVIMSDMFELFGFEWYLLFIPKQNRSSNLMNLFICRGDYPPNIQSISVHCKLIIKEIGYVMTEGFQFNDKNIATKLEMSNYSINSDIIQTFPEINISLEMILFDVVDYNGDDVTQKYIKHRDLEIKLNKDDLYQSHCKGFEWKIELKDDSKVVSPYYVMIDDDSIEYRIHFESRNEFDNVEIYVEIKSLPKYIDRICYLCEINVEGIDLNISGIVHFRQYRLKDLLIDVMEIPSFNRKDKDSDSNSDSGKEMEIVSIQMTKMKVHYNTIQLKAKSLSNDSVVLIDDLLNRFSS